MSWGSDETVTGSAASAPRPAGTSRARMASRAIQRATAASITTPNESAEAPTAAPGRSVAMAKASAATDIETSRTTVPPATSRVRPDRMSTPCQKRR